MSVKADVKIIMRKKDYDELNEKIKTFGFEDYELDLWNNKREVSVTRSDFILLEWNYTRWNYDTNELVELIVDYISMLADNNIPCRYIAIYDVGTEDEIKSYGDNPEIIGFIEGCLYIAREIKVGDCFYSM